MLRSPVAATVTMSLFADLVYAIWHGLVEVSIVLAGANGCFGCARLCVCTNHLLLLGVFAPRVLSADRVHCAPSRTSYAPWRALGRARPQCAPTAGPKPISFILPARLYLDSQYLLSFERTNRYKPAASPKRPSVVPLATCAAVSPFARCGMAISPSVSYSVP